MPITSTATDYTNILTSTLERIVPGLEDNIFDSLPFWKKLNQNGAIKKEVTGESIAHLIEYGQGAGTGSTTSSYSGYDTLDVTPYEFMTRAYFSPKLYARPITITGEDLHKNAGPEKVLDLLEAKTKNAIASLRDDLSVDTFGDGTGNSSKTLTGLGALVALAPGSGTVGNIDRSVYTWWANQYHTTLGSFAANGLKEMRVLYNECSQGGKEKPDICVTTRAVHEFYEGSLTPQIRYASAGGTAEGTFMDLTFKGIPILWDNDCTAGYMYFINSKHLRLNIWKGRNFTTSKFVVPEDQDVQIAQVMFMGNFSMGKALCHGVAAAITA